MKKKELFSSQDLEITLDRLCHQLLENHEDFKDTVIIGLQPRGIYLARRLHKKISKLTKNPKIPFGELDATFYRDDFRKRQPVLPKSMNMDFIVEDKNVVLVDDVLHTGRTIRAGLDALLDFGRPRKVELLVLIDRRFSRHLPIQPDYVGKRVDTIVSQNVKVEWKEEDGHDRVWLILND
ncbi:MAG TPA: bifunctional pyr operon transcriptional regulator/uracil phosphoribosyltransferase PyrR [Bacteroidia bacterium]|jgi:pyrimidine operon attenuation protein/uracil phosphoribosyltransferase|nr:bifunctional pyr operon transcriptional regulator/uracil phosphoribosyltransferase PyrR [Bacteroidia bacterium]